MTAVEWLIQEHFGGIENCTPDFRNKIEQAKEMEKQREKSIFSIAYRMMPTEYGKEHCEAEFEKFIQPNL